MPIREETRRALVGSGRYAVGLDDVRGATEHCEKTIGGVAYPVGTCIYCIYLK